MSHTQITIEEYQRRIAVMNAFLNGGTIEWIHRSHSWSDVDEFSVDASNSSQCIPMWNWDHYDHRVS